MREPTEGEAMGIVEEDHIQEVEEAMAEAKVLNSVHTATEMDTR